MVEGGSVGEKHAIGRGRKENWEEGGGRQIKVVPGSGFLPPTYPPKKFS